MSMWDKPEGMTTPIEEWTGTEIPFVLEQLEPLELVDTGGTNPARKTRLTVRRIVDGTCLPDAEEVTTLAAAIADMAEAYQPGDLPAVVRLREYDTKRGNRGRKLTLVDRQIPPIGGAEPSGSAPTTTTTHEGPQAPLGS